MVFVQLVTGALLDNARQQLTQGFLLGLGQHAEDLVVRGDRVADDGFSHLAALVGEERLQNSAVLGILLALHEPAPFQCGQRELHSLRS